MLVGGELLKIKAAKGQVGLANDMAAFIYGENFKQPVRRNNRAVCCGHIFGGKQAKGNGGNLAICADTELFILL